MRGVSIAYRYHRVSMSKLISSGLLLIFGIVLVHGSGCKQARVARAETDITLGKRIYLENCAACHGQTGDGKGPEADRLKTKPRDFTTGNYKFRSTRSGSLPTDEDIFRSISQGVRTTSMLAQLHLSEGERWALTEYLKTFSDRFTTQKPPDPIPIPVEPSPTRDLITLGKRLYADAGCAECHGAEGRGDGASAKGLKDEAGNQIDAADLTLRPFKSGSTLQDLYRTVSTGLNGTPMPSYADVLSAKERWALVHYIFSIATRERSQGMMGLVGEEIQGMRIDMRAAMAGMMGNRGMMGRGGGMMDRNMRDMMKDMMGR